jgi:hypothetical protein
MNIEVTYTPKGEIVCKNTIGLVFFLTGEPPKGER